MSAQDQLTENLWFLSKLLPSNPLDPNYYGTGKHEFTFTILNAVAIYLTTGHHDSVIACYYKDAPATLILAKGGRVNDEDRSAVTTFLKELTVAKDWLDLIPFLSRRSPDKVNKKICKLRTFFVEYFDYLCETAREYQPDPESSSPEFCGRWSRAFLKRNGWNQTVLAEIPQILVQVLTLCKDYLTGNREFGNTQTAWMDFIQLLYATKTLFDSQFLDAHGGVTLKRRLAKVTQYVDIHYAIKFLRGLGGEINVEWVTDVGYGTIERMLDTREVGNRFEKTFIESWDFVNDAKDILRRKMDIKFSGWRGDKEGSIQVTLFVHPEIRLFLDLIKRNMASNRDIVIGCSQRRCFACKIWIEKLEFATQTRLITNLECGKPRFDWVFPDLAVLRRDDNQPGADLNFHVKREVENWIASLVGEKRSEAFHLYLDNKMLMESPGY